MSQITIRIDADLIDRVKAQAALSGRSMNEYVTRVLDAATDPDLAGSDAERARERLRAAGLLVHPEPHPSAAQNPDAVERARRRAGTGEPLSDLVDRDRDRG